MCFSSCYSVGYLRLTVQNDVCVQGLFSHSSGESFSVLIEISNYTFFGGKTISDIQYFSKESILCILLHV